jgi:hypothetical protein
MEDARLEREANGGRGTSSVSDRKLDIMSQKQLTDDRMALAMYEDVHVKKQKTVVDAYSAAVAAAGVALAAATTEAEKKKYGDLIGTAAVRLLETATSMQRELVKGIDGASSSSSSSSLGPLHVLPPTGRSSSNKK